MKLYVCWGTFQTPAPAARAPCHNAYDGAEEAGHDPEVDQGPRARRSGRGSCHLKTDGRREVERLSGQRVVPVLVTDDGEVVADSQPDHRVGGGAIRRSEPPASCRLAVFGWGAGGAGPI